MSGNAGSGSTLITNKIGDTGTSDIPFKPGDVVSLIRSSRRRRRRYGPRRLALVIKIDIIDKDNYFINVMTDTSQFVDVWNHGLLYKTMNVVTNERRMRFLRSPLSTRLPNGDIKIGRITLKNDFIQKLRNLDLEEFGSDMRGNISIRKINHVDKW